MRQAEPNGDAPAEAVEAVDATPPADGTLLPRMAGDVDLGADGLFVRGAWAWAAVGEGHTLGRCTRDPRALAGFRAAGSALELTFGGGPQATAVDVVLDGEARRIELRAPTEQPRTYRYVLGPGEHVVLLRPAARPGVRETCVPWLGGRIESQPALPFRIDPSLGLTEGEVGRYGTGKARLTAVEVLDWFTGQPVSEVAFGQRVRLRLHAERVAPVGGRVEFSYIVRDRNRMDIFGTTTVDERVRLDASASRFVVEFAFDVRLGPGSYSVLAAVVECSEDLTQRVPMDQIDIAAVLNVSGDPQRPVWYVYHEPVAVAAATYGPDGAAHGG
jgi:hypothetical protein